MEDDRRQSRLVDAMVANEPLSGCGVRPAELERNAVAADQAPQLVATGRPLLADDAIDQVPRPMGNGPGSQRLLNLRAEPFLGGDPSLEDEEVDAPKRGRPLN